jgi:hypothetical protein
MTSKITISDEILIDKHIRDIFDVDYTQNVLSLLDTLQAKIPEINIQLNDRLKMDIIYKHLLEHLYVIFNNTSTFMSKSTNIHKSNNDIYLSNADIFIIHYNNRSNKYIQLIENCIDQNKINTLHKKDIISYALLCNHFKIKKNVIPSVINMLNYSITDNKQYLVFTKKNGTYDKFMKILKNTEHTVYDKIIFKIYIEGIFCSLIYIVESNTLDFIYLDQEEEDALSFDMNVLSILSNTLFTSKINFTSLNVRNLDSNELEEDYNITTDLKLWVCILLSYVAPKLDTTDILDYINTLSYVARDIFYTNIVVFLFKHSHKLVGGSIDYSNIIQDLIEQKTNIVSTKKTFEQSGGGSHYKNNKQNTLQLIRNLFTIE